MGNKPSKPTTSHSTPSSIPDYSAEQKLGKDIVDRIQLKTQDAQGHFQQLKSTKFYRRQQLDKETENTVSWPQIPELFAQPATNEARKLVQKYFRLIKNK